MRKLNTKMMAAAMLRYDWPYVLLFALTSAVLIATVLLML
jgi:Flp pilus assembly protein protease CpaA